MHMITAPICDLNEKVQGLLMPVLTGPNVLLTWQLHYY